MAEVIGTIAGGFAFAKIIIKIGSRVFTLKHLWEDIKGISDTIKSLIGDIELLYLILQEIETDLNSSIVDGTAWSGGIGFLLHISCRSALDILIVSIDELLQELSSPNHINRAVAKSKVVLKRDYWAKDEKRL